MAALVAGVTDDDLVRRTPCHTFSVGDLLDHLQNFARGFIAAAAKTAGGRPPAAAAANLPPDWRVGIPRQVMTLAGAWSDPEAWNGMTSAGGLDLPADIVGVVALDELVIHGWDLAKATNQPAAYDGPGLDAVLGMVQHFRALEVEGLFGAAVEIPADAPLLDRILGLTGRDPAWEPSA